MKYPSVRACVSAFVCVSLCVFACLHVFLLYTSVCECVTVLFTHRLMMYRNVGELHQEANWPGVSGGSRQKLMEQLQSESHPRQNHSLHSAYLCTCVSQQSPGLLALHSLSPVTFQQ